MPNMTIVLHYCANNATGIKTKAITTLFYEEWAPSKTPANRKHEAEIWRILVTEKHTITREAYRQLAEALLFVEICRNSLTMEGKVSILCPKQ
jgi:hypothetical protein